ncbi:PEPxxWA-CTERM sorting domain-containing protein [Sphingomonas sp. 8AM]|uniref:PEPxxWA-CTERM sorting domain-containing protein n=1 Tax=Sphingomonas sp. 8AM TaxID=2653170 RepID=UPI0012F28F21|nr:PEPxxWA-CTERM sorting domain-containing protein [Sphingomonas sp. 8AM]VXC35315.1 conserved exported hypothetical protein [Sphingomonas sp. 8AM]
MASFTKIALSVLALALAPAAAQAATTVISLDRAPATGVAGTNGNTVILKDIGAWAHVTSIGYSLTIEALDPSYVNDQHVWFGTSDTLQAKFTPDRNFENSGTARVEGIADLVAMDLDFFLNEDGLLRVELLDSFNTETTPRGFWSGSFSIVTDDIATDGAVPEPATWAMMIAGFGVVGARLRRRSAAPSAIARA